MSWVPWHGRRARICVVALGLAVAVILAPGPSAQASMGGTRLWVARYKGPGSGSDGACCVASSPDGSKVFVTGASLGSTTNNDYATVAYDTSTGGKLWVARYDGLGSGDDEASALGVSPDGSMVPSIQPAILRREAH